MRKQWRHTEREREAETNRGAQQTVKKTDDEAGEKVKNEEDADKVRGREGEAEKYIEADR